ncbi:MAG: PD-(D/E)XK nuclease family protein [Candidatus Nealsonbacteria bacterium DGGOD1a]|nr:MAG: PD-(D/E)XK nuclease family protein [Candidatus Nealsonbacteria bacterium DGGOD1a]
MAKSNNGFSYYKKKLYDPDSAAPFALSRSKVDMFLKCPRCFYLEQRLGIKIPSGPGFSLNNAVDHLLKKEFDIRRAEGVSHPLMAAYGIDAVPARHDDLEIWRENFKGMRVLHQPTNLEMFGAIDDLWINPAGEYHIVDYKATSTIKEITLDDQWKQWYKIQAEFYQWLFRARGFKVNDIAYFVFANAAKDRAAFDAKLEFAVTVIAHNGNDAWVEPTLLKIKDCLESVQPPAPNPDCEYCQYIEKAKSIK